MSTYTRRHLPHFHEIGQPIFITWRLHGSLPAGYALTQAIKTGREFVEIDHQLDRGCTGPLHLKQPQVATLVQEAIQYRHPREYRLHSYVIMANHVHLLISPFSSVSKIMQSLKRYTALNANAILNLTGQSFWQEESFDRLVRNQTEFHSIARYIDFNPVNAGVAKRPEDFPWSACGTGWDSESDGQVCNLSYMAG